MHALVFFIIFFNFSIEKFTFAIVSMTSAVPAALVIALEEFFGKMSPPAAQIGTTIGVVLFPGIPPIECLSAMILFFSLNVFPDFMIAFIRKIVSWRFI